MTKEKQPSSFSSISPIPAKTFLVKMAEAVSSMPPVLAIPLAAAQAALILIADHLTHYQMGFSRFYLIPVLTLTWSMGRHAGVWASTLLSLLWSMADYLFHPWFAGRMVTFWNFIARFGFFLATTYILSGLREALQLEKKVSRTDFLTGAANRRYFFELAQMEINRSLRYQHPFIVAYVDIDNFKTVNDRFGHRAGDLLLRMAAQNIKSSLRNIDVVARLGGDEFAILLPETGPQAARDVMRKVHDNLMAVMKAHHWPVTLSIGTVTYIQPPRSVDDMIERADSLMYSVKKSGKNTVRYEVAGQPVLTS